MRHDVIELGADGHAGVGEVNAGAGGIDEGVSELDSELFVDVERDSRVRAHVRAECCVRGVDTAQGRVRFDREDREAERRACVNRNGVV